RANYEVENMRVGERTDYNRLRIVIETDGSITPRQALEEAIKILIKQLQAIVEIEEKTEEKEEEITAEKEKILTSEKMEEMEGGIREETVPAIDILKTRVEDLKLSGRTLNALSRAGIRTIGGLVRKKENDLLQLEGIGEKAVEEIKKALTAMKLTLKS
ncbi:MAG: DNA-directed RNA polymerase subunit alpha C-terminal domain-containing protein, partial [Minisyncoccales bacterium]